MITSSYLKRKSILSVQSLIALVFLLLSAMLASCGDDDDATNAFLAEISIASSSTSISENSGSFTITVSLDRENISGNDLIIPLSVNGSATASSDYEAIPANLEIGTGASFSEVSVLVIDDQLVEDPESITFTINTTGLPDELSVSGSNSVTVMIIDNDSDVTDCANDNSIDQDSHVCDESPNVSNTYVESIANGERTITTNGIPTQGYRIQIPQIVSQLNASTKTFTVSASPQIASSVSSITVNGRPLYKFGVALNGVPIDPAPAQPFIFENQNTGEFNFDWVFEPNWNMDAVGLDCAIAHVQPDGTYHYHGNMAIYADQLLLGIGSGNAIPTEPVQIGWAADGFPILYKFGPDANGNLKKLQPGYRIKSGDRPGDGITEPCGVYNGKYTKDFEFVTGLGDLDECNGVDRSVTLGDETFSYFYVITEDFPVISRCITGTPDSSFRIGG
ncbi:MAG: YHYH protein [Cyclobacteriaceae bacterium]